MGSLTVTFVEPDGTEKVIENLQPGPSIMEVARTNGIDGITADCGGGCACATCHVYVDDAFWDRVGPPDEIEADMLDMVSDQMQPTSRLSCQIRLRDELDGIRLTVVPAF
jgi:2Fe-2S ferredoxin